MNAVKLVGQPEHRALPVNTLFAGFVHVFPEPLYVDGVEYCYAAELRVDNCTKGKTILLKSPEEGYKWLARQYEKLAVAKEAE